MGASVEEASTTSSCNNNNNNNNNSQSSSGGTNEEPQPNSSPAQDGTVNRTRRSRSKKFRPPRFQIKSMTSELLRSRTTSTMWDTSGLDPFQVFEVDHESCLDLQITIDRGESITKGSTIGDYMDTPDPYVILKVPGSSNSSKRTTPLDNTTEPLWDETFHFYLDPTKTNHTLKVTLMDANYTMDETLGDMSFVVSNLTEDVRVDHTFEFPHGSKIFAKLLLTKNKNPDLRFSLALCQQERDFLQIRRKKVLMALHKLLGDRAPVTDKQVPIMAVLGSGGGFRAMMCLSAAAKTLYETGVLDCATYISGLSGSSWYISSLYSHDSFSKETFETMEQEMREAVTSGWKWKLMNSAAYLASMAVKYREGQPVSFTDFFGHLLGDVLLKERKNSKLTDQRLIVSQGTVPFPLYTCLHAKRSVSCRAFSEWVEFSPYEIGIAKYGTFMKAEHFGSKFMVGKLIKRHRESPLHFLQGVWGSAFTILFKRLVLEGGSANKDMVQMMRENALAQSERELIETYDSELVKEQQPDSGTDDEDDIVGKDDINSAEESFEGSDENSPQDLKITGITLDDSATKQSSNQIRNTDFKEAETTNTSNGNLLETVSNKINKSISADCGNLKKAFTFDFPPKKKSKDNTKPLSSASEPGQLGSSESMDEGGHKLTRKDAVKGRGQNSTLSKSRSRVSDASPQPVAAARNASKKWTERRETHRTKREQSKKGYFDSLKEAIMKGSTTLNCRAGRAGEVLNPFRGLSLKNSFPISPFTESLDDEEDEVDSNPTCIGTACRYQPLDNKAKKLFIVDSGLAFNSPYPLLLRPQRAIDIYLSFDFSMRKTDNMKPFKELLLAEKWACQNKVPFPPVEAQSQKYMKEDFVRELYVFKNESDPFCPVILHFPLVNNKFRDFKAPGVPRTDEEKAFANFEIFDEENVFSSTNFMYEETQFERMTKLVEFNTRYCLDTIKDELAQAGVRKRDNIAKRQVGGIQEVAALFNHVKNMRQSKRGSGRLRLNIAADRETRLLDMLKQQAQTDEQKCPVEREGGCSSDASDYTDCEEYHTPTG